MSDKPAKIEHALNNPKTRLSAPNPQSKGKFATLSWDIWNNNPRFVVNVNDPSFATKERSFGRIQAAMEPATFNAFLDLLSEAIAAEPGWKRNMQMLGNPRGGGGPGVEPIPHADIWIGKDNDGIVFISVIKKYEGEGWPVIKFPFAAPDRRFVKIFHADGTEYNKGDMSVLYARSFIRLLTQQMNHILTKEYVKPPPFIPGNKGGYGGGGGGQRGGYSGGGGGGGGGSDMADDLPF